jgi:hypothetical protein
MPVYRGSRYSEVSVTVLRDTNNHVIRFLHSRVPVAQAALTEPSSIYSVRKGDALDGMSFARSGHERKWHMIGDVNEVFWPFDLQEGLDLVVPGTADFRRKA